MQALSVQTLSEKHVCDTVYGVCKTSDFFWKMLNPHMKNVQLSSEKPELDTAYGVT